MRIENFTDEGGIEIVNIFYKDGSQTSMLKSTYDEFKANEAAAE
jgi:hypothetical protein